MKKCPYCSAQMNDDSLFCTECGRPIPQGNVCPYCGASVNESDVFCQSCGKRVDEKPSMDVSDTTQKKCPYCGASVNDGDVFCENCGRNLADGSIGFIPNEVIPQTYEAEESSSKKIIPIILGVLAVILIGGALWYWNSNKGDSQLTPTINTTVQKGDSITDIVNATSVDIDSIEEVVDSVVDVEYNEPYATDTVATDFYEDNSDTNNEIEDASHCWYVYGSESELKSMRIIDNDKVLKNLNKEYFTEIEINEKKEIKLYSSDVKVLSNHPSDSYELKMDNTGSYKLCIIDPNRFWSNTKYLVVVNK